MALRGTEPGMTQEQLEWVQGLLEDLAQVAESYTCDPRFTDTRFSKGMAAGYRAALQALNDAVSM
jgi:hypothetical protein